MPRHVVLEAAFFGTVKGLCAALIKEGGYEIKHDVAALGITFLLEGLWLDWSLDPHRYRPKVGRAVCKAYLAAIFPKHFGKRQRSA